MAEAVQGVHEWSWFRDYGENGTLVSCEGSDVVAVVPSRCGRFPDVIPYVNIRIYR